jgi:hypothetical protein
MSNGGLPHVQTIHLRNDGTAVVHVETFSFAPGQAVEVSGHLTQASTGAYADFHAEKHIPANFDPTTGPAVLTVELPAVDNLTTDDEVVVVTRVAEVWPTFLELDPATTTQFKGKLQAVWTAKSPPGKAPWAPGAQ